MKTTYVIAECGSTHDGDFIQMLSLMEAAKTAGADAAKLQYWSDPDDLADRRKVPTQYREIYRRYTVPVQWLPALWNRSLSTRIDLMATTYLPQDVLTVTPYVKHFKIASFEKGAWDLLRAHQIHMAQDVMDGRDRWLIVSQGMGANWNACGLFNGEYGVHERQLLDRVKFLHCTSAYPAPEDSLRLGRIRQPEYGMEVDGFSDHSDPAATWTGALAVAAGATIIEAHLRLDTTDPKNPDFAVAMTPAQFTDYVAHIRFAERCIGVNDGGAMHAAEKPMSAYLVENS